MRSRSRLTSGHASGRRLLRRGNRHAVARRGGPRLFGGTRKQTGGIEDEYHFGGHVDQRCEHWVQKSEGRQRDSRGIHTEGPREISHDDATAPAGNLDDLDHLQEVVAEKEHVGAFACDLGAGTHRYSDVGFHQRGSIVDPIAHHYDRLPGTAELSNAIELLLGEKLRLHLVDSELISDCASN